MKFLRKRKKGIDQDLKKIENQLIQFLQPVPIRPDYSTGLHAMILARNISTVPRLMSTKMSNRLLVAGGVLGSLLMLITSIRGLISIISIFKLVFQLSGRNSHRHQTTPA